MLKAAMMETPVKARATLAMKNLLLSVCLLLALIPLFALRVDSQESKSQGTKETHCLGPVYDHKEVSRRARIINVPAPEMTAEARAHRLSRRVVLNVVLCSSGNVTDVEVVQGSTDGMTEKCVEAAHGIKFESAEKDGQPVSQRQEVIYDFSWY